MATLLTDAQRERIESFIENLKNEIGIPYIDVICYREHQQLFRYYTGAGVNGKEQLYMYSCTKPVTVSAAMRLIEEGRLSLDDNVGKYLPEINSAYVVDENGNKRTVGDKMTVRHLITMSAGFNYDTKTAPILALCEKSEGKANLRDFISAFVESPLDFEPGRRFGYSLCHDVLAAVIECVSGKRFSSFVNETILSPIGMTNSRLDNGEEGVADMYMAEPDGEIKKIDEGKNLRITENYESGGAGLVSCVEDYILFADALASGGVAKNGYRVLSEKTLARLYTEELKTLSLDSGFTCIQGDDYNYGLGVRVRKTPTEWGLPVSEFGWDGAAGSYLMVDPVRHISIVIGMHLRLWPRVFKGRHLEIVKAIYNEIL